MISTENILIRKECNLGMMCARWQRNRIRNNEEKFSFVNLSIIMRNNMHVKREFVVISYYFESILPKWKRRLVVPMTKSTESFLLQCRLFHERQMLSLTIVLLFSLRRTFQRKLIFRMKHSHFAVLMLWYSFSTTELVKITFFTSFLGWIYCIKSMVSLDYCLAAIYNLFKPM